MSALIQDLGWTALRIVDQFGKITVFAAQIARALVTRPARVRLFVQEVFNLGVLSLVIICVSGLAVGMVLGLQGYNTLVRFGAEQSLGAVVGLSLIRELGPVLTALLATGRAGSATAAEIGTMVVTEQLDGLRMMSTNPIHYVVMPKALAMIFVMPLLSALFIVCGLWGGYFVGVNLMGLDGGTYMSSLRSAVDFNNDVVSSVLKALIFGMLVGLIATYRGYTCAPTSAGVSSATTSTVVIASVAILIFDYFITALWGCDLMQRSPVRDFAVGMFVLVGIGAIAYLSMNVGGFSFRRDEGLVVYAPFDQIGGLKPRAPVVIAGVKVGQVSSIVLDKNFRARAQLDLKSDLKIPTDTSASIVTSGLLGDRYISLELGGEERYLKPGDEITMTESAVILERLIGKLIHNTDVEKPK